MDKPTFSNDAWSAETYEANANFVPKMTSEIVSWFEKDAKDLESVLDLGCGDAVLTLDMYRRRQASRKPFKLLVGTDASPNMIESSRVKVAADPALQAASMDGKLHFAVVDGQEIRGPVLDSLLSLTEAGKGYDVVFSNAAMHWMKRDPVAVIRGIKSLLRPGGRLVSEFGGHLNVASVHASLLSALRRRGFTDPRATISPWFFPSAQQYERMLEDEGFRVERCELVPRLTPLPTDLGGWLDTFGHDFFAPVHAKFGPDEKAKMKQEVISELQDVLCDPVNGSWSTVYVRLRVLAWKD
ncbi:hypothetical protein HDU93_008498 [Gonapodya sp. JEL0774]|nr:hypothetical protein HDU93_008498 [Gonapodya sp. JEL0774]